MGLFKWDVARPMVDAFFIHRFDLFKRNIRSFSLYSLVPLLKAVIYAISALTLEYWWLLKLLHETFTKTCLSLHQYNLIVNVKSVSWPYSGVKTLMTSKWFYVNDVQMILWWKPPSEVSVIFILFSQNCLI